MLHDTQNDSLHSRQPAQLTDLPTNRPEQIAPESLDVKTEINTAPPSANEKSLFSPVDPDNQVLRLEGDALVEHPEWSVGRIKNVLSGGRVRVRFRNGSFDQYCRPEELSPAF